MNRYLPLAAALVVSVSLAQDTLADRFQRAYYQEHALKDLDQAIETYRAVFDDALRSKKRDLAAKAKLREAICERQRGREIEAVQLLEQLVKDFADQREVQAEAKDALSALGGPRRTLRVYDVSYLLTRVVEIEPLTGMQLRTPEDYAESQGESGVLTFEDEMPAGVEIDPDTLVQLISNNLAEDSWEGNSRISVEGENLVLVNTAEVHREVEALLERLHALRGRTITFDVRTIAITQAGYAALELGPGGTRALSPAQLKRLTEQLDAKQAFEIERRQLSTPNRVGVEAATPRQLDYLGSFAWDLSGVVPVQNAVVEQGTQANAVWLRPTLVASGEHMLLEVLARVNRWDTSTTQEVLSSEIPVEVQLPVVDSVSIEETLLVKHGQAVLVGGVQSSSTVSREFLSETLGWGEAANQARLLFVVQPSLETPAKAPKEAPIRQGRREVRVYNVALVLGQHASPRGEHLRELLYAPDGGWAEEEDPQRSLELDVLLEMLRENLSPDSWDHPGNWIEEVGVDIIAVSQTPAVHASVRSFLSTLERGPGSSQTVALELLDVELPPARLNRLLDAAPKGRGSQRLTQAAVEALLSDDSTRVRRWGSGTSVNGNGVAFEATRKRRYLRGGMAASGGTGQVVKSIVTPQMGVVRSGYSLAALPRAMRDGRVSLSLDYRVETEGSSQRATLEFGTVELPNVRKDSKRVNTALDPKQVLVVAAEISGGSGRLVLVRVRVDKLLGE